LFKRLIPRASVAIPKIYWLKFPRHICKELSVSRKMLGEDERSFNLDLLTIKMVNDMYVEAAMKLVFNNMNNCSWE